MNASLQLNQFVNLNGIRPADAIVASKPNFQLVKHFLVYLGQDYWNRPVFMANMAKRGVTLLEPEEVVGFADTFKPTDIQAFQGDDFEREEAVDRALAVQDVWSYNLILRNCEHFKNWVQEGLPKSIQTKDMSLGFAAGGAIVGLASGNKTVQNIAWGAALVGLIIYLIEAFRED